MSRIERLTSAMEAFLRYRDRTEGLDRDAFLTRYEDLRDLLEPMLDDPGAAPERATAAPDPAALQPGRQVGDYRIVREVGRGGMGIVFEADQLSLRRRVALKLLHPHLAWSAHSIERFRHEATAVARLRHPAIVPIHEVGEWHGLHYFSMDFVHGRPLSEQVHKERLGVRPGGSRAIEAAQVVASVADALQHAHDHGLVHRDVKPHNVMVGDDGAVHLLDFGLVKNVESASQSASGAFLGTPHYCSPEQIIRGGVVGPRTDVFSLAIVLYELVARRRPFDGETTRVILGRIEAGEFEPLRRAAPSTPRDLETICHKALETEPAARYASAGEFAADLRRFVAGEPILAKPPGRLLRGLQWARRHRLRVALVGAASLLVVGGPAVWALHQYDKARTIERERAVLDRAEELGFSSIEQTLALIGEQLDRQPGLSESHTARVDDVVSLCEKFLRLRAEDPRRRTRVARALYVTSHVYSRIGKVELGMASCERALEIVRATEAEAKGDLAGLEDRLLRRRLHLRQQLPPHQTNEEFEAAIAPWQSLAAKPDCDIEIAMDCADIVLARARVLADRNRDRPEAERLLRRAIELLPAARLAAHPRAEITVLRARTVLGLVLLATARPQPALEVLGPTDERLGALPPTPLLGVERALATAAIGEALQQLGQSGAAEKSLRKAIAAASSLSSEYPGSQSLRRTLLRSRIRLAAVLMGRQQLDEAERLLRQLLGEVPGTDSWLDLSVRADCEAQLGNCILMRSKGQDRGEARTLFHSAIATLERVVAAQPEQLDFLVSLGATRNNLAAIANEEGAHAEAAAEARLAAEHQRRVLAACPDLQQSRLFLGMHQSQLALAAAHLGDHAAALAAAKEAVACAPRHNPTLRIAAEAVCWSAQRITEHTAERPASGSSGVREAEPPIAAGECAAFAMTALRAIAANDAKEANRWLMAPRFAHLRSRADWKELSEETRR